MNYLAQTTDPWQTYDNNLKKPKEYPVPELGTYGLMMTGSILLAVIIKKYFKGQR